MITEWVRHPPSTPPRNSSPSSHIRSYSAAPRSGADLFPNRMARAISTSALETNSTNSLSPSAAPATNNLSTSAVPGEIPRRMSSYNDDDENMSTIPDPRSRTISPAGSSSNPPSPSHHPDLNDEVATLSNKLINAINHQTNLDDTLNETRHQLDASRGRIRQLELENEGHASQIASGSLVDYNVVEAERKKLSAKLADEVRKRSVAEKEKAAIELELENLTTALFEEANKMVITSREEARRVHDDMRRKNDQLKAQLADTETLLKSHQEQLAGLKQVVEQMNEEREDQTNPSAPPTPGLKHFDHKETGIDRDSMVSHTGDMEFTPSYPTSFTHLLQPILRTDLAAYGDFVSLVRSSKSGPGSRVSSGTYGAFALGLGLGGQQSPVLKHTASNGSNSSIATTANISSTPATPTTPASTISTGTASGGAAIPLKETRFYKRALAEDIEPTLRLDTAPGLSWLARRSVLYAMCEGTLVVDPMPEPTTAAQKLYVFVCSLCGESRKDIKHARTHRFRTSENETAQRYPLCKYCLGRVRSSCDFLGFLRMLKDGHWRCEDEEAEKNAWEESVRLREQMFWARMGGGVVPISTSHNRHSGVTPKISEEVKMLKEVERTGEIQPKDITPVSEGVAAIRKSLDEAEHKVSMAKKRASRILQEDTAEGLWKAAQQDALEPPALELKRPRTAPAPETDRITEEASMLEEIARPSSSSAQSPAVSTPEPDNKEEMRLSLTIPKTN